MSNIHNYLVIMAGGVGSRFWPMSTEEHPKQFLDILGQGRTLLQATHDRFKRLVTASHVYIVTSAKYRDIVREQLPSVPPENILTEPCRRNTAPAIAYASWRIKKRDANANVVVTAADHYVEDADKFCDAVGECLDFTAESDGIVTIGIRPTNPETGYGYIEADMTCASPTNNNIFRVDSFKEKPDEQTARQYMASPNYFWNAGVFVWRVHTIVNAFRVYQPGTAQLFESIFDALGTEKEAESIAEIFPNCENISIDYAVMEKADDLFVSPVNVKWSDLGTWSSMKQNTKQDIHGNALIGGDIQTFDTQNTIVYTSYCHKVVVQGLDGYIVVEKDGILLICKLSEEQRIKLFH